MSRFSFTNAPSLRSGLRFSFSSSGTWKVLNKGPAREGTGRWSEHVSRVVMIAATTGTQQSQAINPFRESSKVNFSLCDRFLPDPISFLLCSSQPLAPDETCPPQKPIPSVHGPSPVAEQMIDRWLLVTFLWHFVVAMGTLHLNQLGQLCWWGRQETQTHGWRRIRDLSQWTHPFLFRKWVSSKNAFEWPSC